MRDIRQIVRQLLLLAALMFSINGFANSDNLIGDGPRWACWYSSHQLSVQCLLIHAPTEGTVERATQVAAKIDSRLPELVKVIWGSPEQLAGRYVSIPLMSIPFEMEFVGVLAKSVMCGARTDCSILFDKNSDGYASVRAAALESGSSESEIMAEISAQGVVLAQAEQVLPAGGKKRRRGVAEI